MKPMGWKTQPVVNVFLNSCVAVRALSQNETRFVSYRHVGSFVLTGLLWFLLLGCKHLASGVDELVVSRFTH